MFPDDDQVFPFEKIEEERISPVFPVQTGPDDERPRVLEVNANPSCSRFKEDLGKILKRLKIRIKFFLHNSKIPFIRKSFASLSSGAQRLKHDRRRRRGQHQTQGGRREQATPSLTLIR